MNKPNIASFGVDFHGVEESGTAGHGAAARNCEEIRWLVFRRSSGGL